MNNILHHQRMKVALDIGRLTVYSIRHHPLVIIMSHEQSADSEARKEPGCLLGEPETAATKETASVMRSSDELLSLTRAQLLARLNSVVIDRKENGS